MTTSGEQRKPNYAAGSDAALVLAWRTFKIGERDI
jgi:hypothetical protein